MPLPVGVFGELRSEDVDHPVALIALGDVGPSGRDDAESGGRPCAAGGAALAAAFTLIHRAFRSILRQ